MVSRSSFTRREYSSIVTCGTHWKGVCGLGTKQEVDTVMRTPRLLFAACCFQQRSTFSASSAMATTSSSVSVGRPSMK